MSDRIARLWFKHRHYKHNFVTIPLKAMIHLICLIQYHKKTSSYFSTADYQDKQNAQLQSSNYHQYERNMLLVVYER